MFRRLYRAVWLRRQPRSDPAADLTRAYRRRYERVRYAGEADPDTAERAVALAGAAVAEHVRWWSR
ncbi:hypothetical protein [Halapricum desulfuricans]|uniref:Transglutaminase-like cysteine protease n=1 Tax=Halapricum desulfuricans TaxID=2841257 RepID=A0A897NF76_9EURY|nr:hypothetical protein [Halapricum desulfuricans]QSG07794.1 Transglutaminase-like cysteine protease [Halapricum desulfuricans]QSG13080.1 Transglutaminase-like cysteine protease [Halapricum desulfuricans]